MIVRKHFLAATLLLFATAATLAAQNTALGFIRIDRNPRSSALAGAGAASVGNGAYGAFKNAASLPSIEGLGDAFASVQLWQMSNPVDKSTNLIAGVGFHFGQVAVAVGGVYQRGVPDADFTPSDGLFSLGLAYDLQAVSIGVNARYARQNLAPSAKVSGFSADISVRGRIGEEFSLIGGVACLGAKVKGSSADYAQPTHAFLGADWKHNFASKHGLELALDGEYNFDKSFAGAIGAEYAYDNLAFLRVGYRLASKNAVIPSHLAVGLGVRLGGFRADVSYLTASPILGNTLSIGVGYQF